MDTELIRSKAEEINRLHKEVFAAIKIGLDGAIRIGELLTEVKESLKHGEWLRWVKENLSFSYKTAERYMNLYEEGHGGKLDSLSNLWEAEQALIEHKVVKEPALPKEPDLPPEEESEPLPVRLQPYVTVSPKSDEGVNVETLSPKSDEGWAEPELQEPETVEEPELDEQDELAQDIKDLFQRLDQDRKVQIIKDLYWMLDWNEKQEFVLWIKDTFPGLEISGRVSLRRKEAA